MKRILGFGVLAVVTASLLAGCGNVEDRAVVTISDNEGQIEARVVTVGYVNDRLDRIAPTLLPDVPGEEGKKQFIEEIIRKELLVIQAHRLGFHEDERLATAKPYFADTKARSMFTDETVTEPSKLEEGELQEFLDLRTTSFQVLEIIVQSEEVANEAYRRVTEGGEDFGAVAAELSTAQSAEDHGRREVQHWLDMHPLIRVAIKDYVKDVVTEPILIGTTWYMFKILSRKVGPPEKPYEGAFLTAVELEAGTFKRQIVEHAVFAEMMESAAMVFNDEAVEIAGRRIVEKMDEVLPPLPDDAPFEERMERARVQVVPDFTDEEAGIEFMRYTIGGEEIVMSLADLHDLIAETPGMETPKGGEYERITSFMKRTVRDEIIEYEVDVRGYRDSQEVADYVESRSEELMIDFVYETEVSQKVAEPMGQEVRDYFRSHRDDFIKPAAVDVQQIIVGTENEANLIVQRLEAGEAEFFDLVQKHSIDEWSKSKDGIITGYEQGERRLDYLQGVAFDLEVGEISQPFRAPGGYAVVRVLAAYPEEMLAFSDVADVVKISVWNLAKEARLLELLDGIRASCAVEYTEGNLKYVKDPTEVREERESERVTVSKTIG
jgi:parvulin-like peptidyl-prolyl isomerase